MQSGKCSFIFSASVAQEDHWNQSWWSANHLLHRDSSMSPLGNHCLCYGQSYFFSSLLSTSPFANDNPLIFLWRTTLPLVIHVVGWGWPQTPVPGEVHVPALGNYCTPSPILAQYVIPQRVCEGMWYHPRGDMRKRRDSHLSWAVETFTNIEAGGRILRFNVTFCSKVWQLSGLGDADKKISHRYPSEF